MKKNSRKPTTLTHEIKLTRLSEMLERVRLAVRNDDVPFARWLIFEIDWLLASMPPKTADALPVGPDFGSEWHMSQYRPAEKKSRELARLSHLRDRQTPPDMQ